MITNSVFFSYKGDDKLERPIRKSNIHSSNFKGEAPPITYDYGGVDVTFSRMVCFILLIPKNREIVNFYVYML